MADDKLERLSRFLGSEAWTNPDAAEVRSLEAMLERLRRELPARLRRRRMAPPGWVDLDNNPGEDD